MRGKQMTEVKILYEDKDIIVVVKPAGMASQEERSVDVDMVSWLKDLSCTPEESQRNALYWCDSSSG